MGEQLRLADELGTFQIRHAPVEARPLIAALKAEGLGPTAIARRLNATGVSTPTGRGRWYPETVQRHHDPARWAAWQRDYYRRRHG